MSAYVILDITVHEPELFEQYKRGEGALIIDRLNALGTSPVS